MHKVKRRFRFYPTKEQEIALSKIFGCTRFVYNHGLNWRKEQFENGNKPTYNKSSSWLTNFKNEYEFLNDVSCVPLQQSLRHLQTAYVNFFKKRAKYPTFKKRNNRQSCEFTERAFLYKNKSLRLSKIGKLNIVWTLELESKPTTVTVIKEPSGKYFVSLTIVENDKFLFKIDSSIGVDLGIETFATLSNGQKFKQPEKIRKLRKKLAALQRKHSRTKKDSKRREKARIKVARLHEYIVNIRKDFLHKLSTQLVRENQTICVENLNVKGMIKNRKLSRCISEQGWRDFINMLTYKCLWSKRKLEVVDRWFASSKTCSKCGEKQALKLSERSWECSSCGTIHDRDINASINILAAGQAAIARGGSIRPERIYFLKARPMKREPINL